MRIKNILLCLFSMISLVTLYGQSPEKFSYQAAIRNSANEVISEQAVSIEISIIQGSPSGSIIYTETHTPTTNINGLVSLEIGTGITGLGDFSLIDWSQGPYFLQSLTDPAGGDNYALGGVMELISVPFALYAQEAEGTLPEGTEMGELLFWDGEEWIAVAPGNDNEILTFCDGVPVWRVNGQCPLFLPTIVTSEVINITATSAQTGGNITDEGNTAITNRGVCWSTTPTPDLSDNVNNLGTGAGSFSSVLFGLAPGTTYYVRAFAQNAVGLSFGNEVVFTTVDSPGGPILPGNGVTDIEGNNYPSIVLPNGQEWMAKNLATTTFPDGSPVTAGPSADLSLGYSTDNAYYSCLELLGCQGFFPGDCGADCGAVEDLGYVYQWSAAMNGSAVEEAQGICPDGWHLPSDDEWKAFEQYLGMQPVELDAMGWRGTDQGSQLAGNPFPTSDQSWGLNTNPNTIIENNPAFSSSGFNAPAPGTRYSDGNLYARGANSYYWTSTQVNSEEAIKRGLNANETGIIRHEGEKALSFSLRCVKD